jgi:hypothetical protein
MRWITFPLVIAIAGGTAIAVPDAREAMKGAAPLVETALHLTGTAVTVGGLAATGAAGLSLSDQLTTDSVTA